MFEEELWIKNKKESVLLSLFAEILREVSNDSYCDSKQRFSRNKNCNNSLNSKLEEEKLQKRQQWLVQQKQEWEHERQKKKMILEYELQRACKKSSKVFNKGSLDHSQSKTRSESDNKRTFNTSGASLLLGQVLSSKTLSKSSEYLQISTAELHRIRIDIHRNIYSKSVLHKLQKDIHGPKGKGFKPICKRDDFKKPLNESSCSERNRDAKSKNKERGDLYKDGRRYTSLQKEDRYNKFRQRSPKKERKNRLGGWRNCLPILIKQVPVPIYYGNQTMGQLPAPGSILSGRYPKMGPNISGGNPDYGRALLLTESNLKLHYTTCSFVYHGFLYCSRKLLFNLKPND